MALTVNQLMEHVSQRRFPETPEEVLSFQQDMEAIFYSNLISPLAAELQQSMTVLQNQLQNQLLSLLSKLSSSIPFSLVEHTVSVSPELNASFTQYWILDPMPAPSGSGNTKIFERPGPYLPTTPEPLIVYSPSLTILALLEKLRTGQIALQDLHWRQLEEIVSALLTQEGYEVLLGPGSKDGGRDLIAMKHLFGVGQIVSVWQAKKKESHNKVELDIIRLLDYTRIQNHASKGVIVTTTTLTRDALQLIHKKPGLLHKVDGQELLAWIRANGQP